MGNWVLYEKVSNKAYITLNRPEAMNAMPPSGFQQLAEAFNEAREDDEVRVIILTGAGEQAFCAGADLKETIPAITEGTMDPGLLDDVVLKHTPLWKPIIAAVNGHCLAGGMEILQATDIRIAAEHATFGLPEPKWSIMAAAGSLVRLVRQIPYCRAMEILLTGDSITAKEALDIGLINKVVPSSQLLAEAESYAEKICRNGPIAVQATKEAVVRLQSLPMELAFREEWNYANKAFMSEDAKEGLKAFAEKRAPLFVGR